MTIVSDCIFCEILYNKESKTKSNLLYEDETVAVVPDINPMAPVHLLIIPKKHISSINTLSSDDGIILANMLMVGKEMARQKDINQSGYKLLFNVEKGGGQVIFHLHLHLLGGWI